jgi:bifunctional non-homologous end joining protein LigD
MKEATPRSFSFIEPMKALPVEKLPEGGWLHEIKFDGYRALAFKDGKDVRLTSRNKKAFNYPQLLGALKLLPAECLILDGEIAALDEKDRSSFQLLQIFKSSGNVPLVYYAFDLLFLDGKDLREQRLSARRKLLAKLLEKAPENIRFLR